MFQIFVGVPAFVQLGVATFVILGILKVYLILTLGVCTSKNKLTGKTVIITGANAGIGKETAIDLAKRGARVIMACRDLKRAVIAKDEIVRESGNCNVFVYELNLASLKSVRKFADEILKNEPRLDVLINNAGCAGIERKLTEDGLEYQMQSNYFGHFLLTNLLLGLMLKTDNARVVNVASDHHSHCKQLNVDDLNFEHDSSVGKMSSLFKIYGISKLCNVLFSLELANKLKPLGKNVTTNALHPGVIMTEFMNFLPWLKHFCRFFAPFYAKSTKEGAQTSIHLAVSDEVANITGEYFSDCKIKKPSKLARDAGLAKKLWEITETLVHLTPEEKHF